MSKTTFPSDNIYIYIYTETRFLCDGSKTERRLAKAIA